MKLKETTQNTINNILAERGFKPLSENRMVFFMISCLMIDKGNECYDNIENEIQFLRLLELLKEQKGMGIRIGNIGNRKKLTIKDAEMIQAMELGLMELYKKKFSRIIFNREPFKTESFMEFFKGKGYELNFDESFIQMRIQWLEFDKCEMESENVMQNQCIGMMAKEFIRYAKEEDIFKGKGKGITKEYAAIYDVLDAIGFEIKCSKEKYQDTETTRKYRAIYDCIKAANKIVES